MTKLQWVDQERLRRFSCGSDWGVERLVLLRVGTKILWKWPGGTAWAGIGRQAYNPTTYCMSDGDGRTGRYTTLETPPRFRPTANTLRPFDAQIREYFGIDFDFSEKYERGKTLVVER